MELVSRVKNVRLDKYSILPFAGRQSWVKRLESALKCKGLFDLVVTTILVTRRGSINFCFAPKHFFQCFIFEPRLLFDSEWVCIFELCVSCFLKNALAHTSCCFTMATGLYIRAVTFRSSSIMTSMWSLVKVVTRSKSIAKLSDTVNSTVVGRSPFMTRNVMLRFILNASFDAADGTDALP